MELARLFGSFRAYDIALSEMEYLLKQNPENFYAFVFGGELIVRCKLGVARFKDAEYLYGSRTEEVAAKEVDDAYVITQAKKIGAGKKFSVLHNLIGVELLYKRDKAGAVKAFERALSFDPDNRVAKTNLDNAQI